MPENPRSAKALCESKLEETGAAMLAGDYPAFARHFVFPFKLETMTDLRIYKQQDEFRAVFDSVHKRLLRMRVTIMARNCVAAEYRDADTIVGTHETRMISHGQLIEEPFPVMSVFVRQADQSWKCSNASYFVPEGSLYGSAFRE